MIYAYSYKNSMAVMILQSFCGFSMMYVILHVFPGLENSLTKFHDSLWLINVIVLAIAKNWTYLLSLLHLYCTDIVTYFV